jgi:hypothetical protein
MRSGYIDRDPRQGELFPVLPIRRAGPTRAVLEHELADARSRLHEVVILRMKTWLPEETLKGLQQVESFRREEVRVHFRILEKACAGAPAPPHR